MLRLRLLLLGLDSVVGAVGVVEVAAALDVSIFLSGDGVGLLVFFVTLGLAAAVSLARTSFLAGVAALALAVDDAEEDEDQEEREEEEEEEEAERDREPLLELLTEELVVVVCMYEGGRREGERVGEGRKRGREREETNVSVV